MPTVKEWLDQNLIPLLTGPPPMRLHSFIWKGDPPDEILVWLLADGRTPKAQKNDQGEIAPSLEGDFDPDAWPASVQRLLTHESFGLDYTRESIMVQLAGGLVPVFGGDGSPLFGPSGMASVRLYKKFPDGVGLILQLGCQYQDGTSAAIAVKGLYQQLGTNPLELAQQFGAPWGQA